MNVRIYELHDEDDRFVALVTFRSSSVLSPVDHVELDGKTYRALELRQEERATRFYLSTYRPGSTTN